MGRLKIECSQSQASLVILRIRLYRFLIETLELVLLLPLSGNARECEIAASAIDLDQIASELRCLTLVSAGNSWSVQQVIDLIVKVVRIFWRNRGSSIKLGANPARITKLFEQ